MSYGLALADVSRQLATGAGAWSLVVLGSTGEYGEEGEPRSPAVPAAGAFSIWGPLFAGSLALTALHSLPSRRSDPLMRELGWPLAVAYGGAGLWSRVFELRQLPWSLALIGVTWLGSAVAYHRLPPPGATSTLEDWTVRVPVSALFGWLTLAAILAKNEELLAPDNYGDRLDPQALAVVSIAGAGVLASGLTLSMDRSFAFPAAVAWGLGGIVLRQAEQRPVVAGVAAAALGGLGLSVLLAWRRRRRARRATDA
jgi:hypothetical protein